jgi:hypothetical protein
MNGWFLFILGILLTTIAGIIVSFIDAAQRGADPTDKTNR